MNLNELTSHLIGLFLIYVFGKYFSYLEPITRLQVKHLTGIIILFYNNKLFLKYYQILI